MTRSQTPVTLHLLCGKMAAGKSTLAKKLASGEENMLLLSEDDLLATLFPDEISDIPTYVNRSNRLKSAFRDIIVQLLSQGSSIVMDFPANTTSQRAWLLALANAAGVNHQLHYIDLPDATCKAQLLMRASEKPERAATDTEAMFDAITKYFEPPKESEGLNINRIDASGA